MRGALRYGVLLALLAVACRPSPVGSPPPTPVARATPTVRPASLFLTPVPTPEPVVFPRDAGTHDVLTEWWYYTGHLWTADGRRYGFEFVVFQGQRMGYPTGYAAHFAVTDVAAQSFYWAERTDVRRRPTGGPPLTLAVADWTLDIGLGEDRIRAAMPGYVLDLALRDAKPPVLHDGDGFFSWAPQTGSYYYSRTRLEAKGILTTGSEQLQVSGIAWMDHQWGDFLLTGRGGWNWFALQSDDGRELMLWNTHDGMGRIVFGAGTYVAPDGSATMLDGDHVIVTPTGTWTSPHTGATYPSGWVIALPALGVRLTVTPLLLDQELQTLQSTGVVYWEGAVDWHGTIDGRSLKGVGYVELTGYARPESGVAPASAYR